jgi:hypothetical protein
MEKVDLNRVFATLTPDRRTQVVANVNEGRLRLVRLSGPGTLDAHPHDEFALVLNGELTVEVGER